MINFIPPSAVKITGGFWAPITDTNRQVTIPIEYQQCQQTGRIDAFRLEWKPGQPQPPHIFWDSDVAKWIEAASYSLSSHPDDQLDQLLDETIALVASAQQPDGYLNVHFTVVEPEKRWSNLRDLHELYCAGHLIEAGVAHFQSTGKRSLLDVIVRYADYIASVFGTQPGQLRGYPGHEEIELALVKLYKATGEDRFLDLARYFVDERGRDPHYFDIEAEARGEDPAEWWGARGVSSDLRYAYAQAHLPVRQQRQVMGHAVRAMYLYSAMADLAVETQDEVLRQACEALWEDVCLKKMYITGGIGPSRHNEGFTLPYDLPNASAYAETCAAIGLVFWNQRMLRLDGDSRYADVLERALYNGVLSGVSLDGERFFYVNPLESDGTQHRQPWFDCACCPPNVARLLASLGGTIYSQDKSSPGISVHLFIHSRVQFDVDGVSITLNQDTRYPWDGKVRFTLDMQQPASFNLRLRLPGWCRSAALELNGENVECLNFNNGYIEMDCDWNPGDELVYQMEMPVERVYAHPQVSEDVHRIAIQRGPLVYCVEQADHDTPLNLLRLDAASLLDAAWDDELLGGMVVVQGDVFAEQALDWQDTLYRHDPPARVPVKLRAIPYFAWDNREPGAMRVWL